MSLSNPLLPIHANEDVVPHTCNHSRSLFLLGTVACICCLCGVAVYLSTTVSLVDTIPSVGEQVVNMPEAEANHKEASWDPDELLHWCVELWTSWQYVYRAKVIVWLWILLWGWRYNTFKYLWMELSPCGSNRPPCCSGSTDYKFRPNSYPKLLLFWLPPMCFFLIGFLILITVLIEIMQGAYWTGDALKWFKFVCGFWLLSRSMYFGSVLTIAGNKKGAKNAAMSDAKFIGWAKFFAYLGLVISVWVSWSLRKEHEVSKLLSGKEGPECEQFGDSLSEVQKEPKCRPLVLIKCDVVTIILATAVILYFCLIIGFSNLYAIRTPNKRWSHVVDKSWPFSYILNALQVFISLEPSTMFDMVGLWERIDRRMGDRFCHEWAHFRGRKTYYVPALMREGRDLLDYPLVNTIDWWTKIFLRLVRYIQVEPTRLDPLHTEDIKLPFKKMKLKTQDFSFGLKVALMDEQYSEIDKNGDLVPRKATTESSPKVMPRVLNLYDKLPHIEDPRWFKHEMEGVMTYEALIAPFAASCNSHWSDLVSDKGVEDFFRWGLGQAFLLGKGAVSDDTLHEIGLKNSSRRKLVDLWQRTKYVVDYAYAGKYAVRPRCARYGCFACFDYEGSDTWHVFSSHEEKFELLAIYVSHWDWKKYPDQHLQEKRCVGGQTLTAARISAHSDPWVFRPTEESSLRDKKRWEHAKYVVKATLGSFMTIREHLTWQHWIVSNNASINTREKLDRDHPVRRLITPFIVRAPSINYMSTLTLLPEHRFVHRASGFEYPGMFEAVLDSMAAFNYEKEGVFADRVKGRQLGPLENKLPWVQDGKAYWNCVEDYVEAFLAIYYVDSDAVAKSDAIDDIQEWWDSISTMPSGPSHLCKDVWKNGKEYKVADGYGYKLPEFDKGHPKGLLGLLKDYITHLIFGVTADHELYGSVNQYFTTPMGLTTKIWNETVEQNRLDECGQVMQDCQTFLQALGVISGTGVPMPRLLGAWYFLNEIQDPDMKNWQHVMKEGKTKIKLVQSQVEILNKYFQVLKPEPNRKKKMYGYSGKRKSKEEAEADSDSDGRKNIGSASFDSEAYFAKRNERLKTFRNRVTQNPDEVLKPDSYLTEDDHAFLLYKLHSAFMSHLVNLSNEIQLKNKGRGHAFTEYDPDNMECSVSI